MMTPYKKVNVTDSPRLKLAINLTSVLLSFQCYLVI